jgi:hypothetical protein
VCCTLYCTVSLRMSLMKMFLHRAGSTQYNDTLSTEKLRTCVRNFEVCVHAHTLCNIVIHAVQSTLHELAMISCAHNNGFSALVLPHDTSCLTFEARCSVTMCCAAAAACSCFGLLCWSLTQHYCVNCYCCYCFRLAQ